MIVIEDWDKTKSYKDKDIVLFHDKIYIATSDNEGVIPTPAINHSITVDGETILLSNMDSIKLLTKALFNVTSDAGIQSHINNNETWIAVQ